MQSMRKQFNKNKIKARPMEKKMNLLFLRLLFFIVHTTMASACCNNKSASSLSRSSFPDGFVFGTGSSSYQYEGAVKTDGKGPSIWDTYTHKYPGKIADHSTGDVAVDSYHRYKEDVKIMKEMNVDSYRFSISWSRILPMGKPNKGINIKGIQYYNNLINELLSNGIKPFVTLFHWDLPQALEDEYGGFLSPHIVKDFKNYADICFREFGDRVKHWMTLNEPWTYAAGGYAAGVILAPWRCSKWQQLNCTGGDSSTEPYLVAHNLLLAHAAAVRLYKEKYQTTQKGELGISLATGWSLPYSSSREDNDAAERANDFLYGWFMEPLTYGDYPQSMKLFVKKRLPKFTKEQSRMMKGSFDFVGLNYYSASYAAYAPHLNSGNRISYMTDALVNQTSERDGIPIGPKTALSWLYVYPRGLRDMLLYTKYKYNNPVIYITENGFGEADNSTQSLKEALVDNIRIDYFRDHLCYLQEAIEDGVNVKGYFAWSLLDNFEWSSGYTIRFGTNYVDYKNGLKRYPKSSALWFKKFLKKQSTRLLK